MYRFRTLPDDDPIMDSSPVLRVLDFLNAQFALNPKGIPLTKSGAFRRVMVAEAITTIQFPDWTEQEIYHGFGKIRVADEHHFEPLWILHSVLRNMRMVRPYLGHLRLTKAGKDLFSDRFRTFDVVTRTLLFKAEKFRSAREYRNLLGNWDVWLNVIDYEARGGIAGRALTEVFYGPADPAQVYDPRMGDLYSGVLKPLVWSGLLSEDMTDGRKLVDRIYATTPLWSRYLELDPKPPRLRVVK
ncbi:MAG: hypothetical protein HLUCCA05_14500 [Roseibaca calidilacus]|uniref:Uncharacterized protein n=2 Tax=Roseibaca calidilacus TaxID=1666912 RepID=A0A0P7W440_9RHOB|nr:MAG: hypothetical protein HLUCCA05_14500 [Roseibaca calidilacus]CUX80031.1 hypothetical protein Ga0058931_0736 [Roseibaca calidilacus]